MSLVSTLSGYTSGVVFAELAMWNKRSGGGIVFDSSTGFTLPDRSVLSPDASWVSKEKWSKLSHEDKDRFAPLCPEFVIEVKSKSDYIEQLKKKMLVWLTNGATLGWLIDPSEEIVYVYKQAGEVKEIRGFKNKVDGEYPVEGFTLDLSLLKKI